MNSYSSATSATLSSLNISFNNTVSVDRLDVSSYSLSQHIFLDVQIFIYLSKS